MFYNGLSKNYNVDLMSTDLSLHSGIPKHFYNLKERATTVFYVIVDLPA